MLARSYYRGAQAALVVFDVTNTSSFERAKKWIEEIHNNTEEKVIIALIANKIDIPDHWVNLQVKWG